VFMEEKYWDVPKGHFSCLTEKDSSRVFSPGKGGGK